MVICLPILGFKIDKVLAKDGDSTTNTKDVDEEAWPGSGGWLRERERRRRRRRGRRRREKKSVGDDVDGNVVNMNKYYITEPNENCRVTGNVIRSKAECKIALTAVGKSDRFVWNSVHRGIPGGCSVRGHADGHYDNRGLSGTVGEKRGDLRAVCKGSKTGDVGITGQDTMAHMKHTHDSLMAHATIHADGAHHQELSTTGGLSCPSGYKQEGSLGADKGGCGLESCDARYGDQAKNENACGDHCDAHSECKSFSYAPEKKEYKEDNVRMSACAVTFVKYKKIRIAPQ